ncbi:hypothetical protein [Haloglycomyces albus]|uniref:hypothetical protein n=1 Tax=Haloglycomyces albus TaxID=526067 RepID=UPI00046D95B2|nr:hypothetical protein [Haloglycomyces albus]
MPSLTVQRHDDHVQLDLPPHLNRNTLGELGEFGRSLTGNEPTVVVRPQTPGGLGFSPQEELIELWSRATEWMSSPSHVVISVLPPATLIGMGVNLALHADVCLAEETGRVRPAEPELNGRVWPLGVERMTADMGIWPQLREVTAVELWRSGIVRVCESHDRLSRSVRDLIAANAQSFEATKELKALLRQETTADRERRRNHVEAARRLWEKE